MKNAINVICISINVNSCSCTAKPIVATAVQPPTSLPFILSILFRPFAVTVILYAFPFRFFADRPNSFPFSLTKLRLNYKEFPVICVFQLLPNLSIAIVLEKDERRKRNHEKNHSSN